MEEENTEETPRIIPSFLKKPDQSSSIMNTHGVQKSLHVLRRSRRRCRDGGGGTKDQVSVKEMKGDCTTIEEKKEGEEEEEEDREEVERKIHALQKIVPNGESFGVDNLFDETATYIMALQSQLKALKALTSFFESLEKDKTKFGG